MWRPNHESLFSLPTVWAPDTELMLLGLVVSLSHLTGPLSGFDWSKRNEAAFVWGSGGERPGKGAVHFGALCHSSYPSCLAACLSASYAYLVGLDHVPV